MSLTLGPTPPKSPEKGYATTGSFQGSGSDSDQFDVVLAGRARTAAVGTGDTWRNIFGNDSRDTPTPPPAVDRG